jgi:hypothetical protein
MGAGGSSTAQGASGAAGSHGGAQPGSGGGSTGGAQAGGAGGGAAGSAPVTDGGVDGGPKIVGGCPRVLLGTALPAEFSGDTTSLPNLVTSTRLEWTDAPDDALEFTAPVAGKYVIELTSSVQELGASAWDYNTNGADGFPFTRTACPAAGAVKEINGFYSHNQPTNPIQLSAGQSMVIFVSVPSFSAVKAGPYTLRVRKAP